MNKIVIETVRLRIVPLTVEQFALLLSGTDKMEKSVGLSPSGEELDSDTRMAMKGLYSMALENTDKYMWYTNWQIILKTENKSIGSACFVGVPGKNGEVEIGYGINSSYWNCGYMTEACIALCKWALRQPGVKKVIAETEKANIRSHRVLKKSGLDIYQETLSSFWWIIEKKN